ncbi:MULTISPECIES: Crp/Fnr family transcriptional regulator [Vibrio]|uniref:Cyclic nucleotide-binding domain-containing protein n=2 Tax=Vibrio TaxID=662 RepID=A0A7X4RTE9_9VIBR|nr:MULTISPECIES: Crp/Fnr family transcriptional regulator [Vibrio]MBF9001723.1 Crp/Fnr family transcriptional regulator [Vibrio nitrifigilis]MZI92363.1 cyclic nucleotide-binding domain-containing protein [Vibrio eleionomae]
MSLNIFKNYLSQHQFSANDIALLCEHASLIELPTSHVFIHQGQNPQYAYFLQSGLCHASYLTAAGEEIGKSFFWEEDWIIGFESLITQAPNPYLLESLTDVSVVQIPLDLLQEWREQTNPLYMRLLEMEWLLKEQKERFQLFYSAQERYQLFQQQFPHLLEQISNKRLADYLGTNEQALLEMKQAFLDDSHRKS